MTLEITENNIDGYLAESKLLLIDFWAEWCMPCKAITPMVNDIAGEYAGNVNIGKCNVEDNNDIAVKYTIRNVPTIVFVKDGEEVDRVVGAVSKAEIVNKIEAHL